LGFFAPAASSGSVIAEVYSAVLIISYVLFELIANLQLKSGNYGKLGRLLSAVRAIVQWPFNMILDFLSFSIKTVMFFVFLFVLFGAVWVIWQIIKFLGTTVYNYVVR
jgi:hypothetical protein